MSAKSPWCNALERQGLALSRAAMRFLGGELTAKPRARGLASGASTSVMIEKCATSRGTVSSAFLDLHHTSKIMIRVSLLIPKFARDASIEVRRTSEAGH